MSDVITRFLNRPIVSSLYPDDPEKRVFVLEADHTAAAWGLLMQKGTHFDHELLWFNTPFQPHMAQGPSWFVVDEKCVEGLAQVCHQRPPGLALSCSEPKAALAHARCLLSMQGSNVLAIQDPAVWAALAMESTDTACLFGPWNKVYTPAPSANPASRHWHTWSADAPATGACQYPLSFPDSVYPTYKHIRWLHWLRQHSQQFAKVPDSELPRVVSNLDFLVKHGIGIDRDLLQLSPLVTQGVLRERADLLPIITSCARPHRRVAQLLEGLQP